MSQYYLSFKFLKNRAISLGPDSDQYFQPHFQMRDRGNSLNAKFTGKSDGSAELVSAGTQGVAPFFFIGDEAQPQHYHKIILADETPRTPVRPASMPDKLYDSLVEAAMTTVIANKASNDEIRRRVSAFVESGTIAIVDDPFAVEMEAFTEKKVEPTKPIEPPVEPPADPKTTKTEPTKSK